MARPQKRQDDDRKPQKPLGREPMMVRPRRSPRRSAPPGGEQLRKRPHQGGQGGDQPYLGGRGIHIERVRR